MEINEKKLFMPVGVGDILYRNELNQEVSGLTMSELWFSLFESQKPCSAGVQIKAHKRKAISFGILRLGLSQISRAGKVFKKTSKKISPTPLIKIYFF